MKIYILNLESDRDRFEHAARAFEAKGLAFERLAAVDGRKMTAEELSACLAYPAAGSYDLSPSQVGCYLSHVHAWQRFLETDAATVAIFEDDVHLGEDIEQVLAAPETWLPEDTDILKLETCLQKVPLPADAEGGMIAGRRIIRLTGRHHGSAGYLLTRKGAEKLLRNSRKLAVGVDAMLFNPRSEVAERPVVYQIDPAICIQDDIADQCGLVSRTGFQSHNVPGRKKSHGVTPFERLRYRIRDRLRVAFLKARDAVRGYRKRVVTFR
ncbi:glycosyltransferase family 25 protein [uncultured Martelella sp.]|uniref:glycosyltransferase family 25 protein n=1 Tax=uncultured Martelella sp. TaxID=392331 RepID=UPI0029C85FD8|nr:glycosyltransferase family 25 protein [uncultured Martelella sp.]